MSEMVIVYVTASLGSSPSFAGAASVPAVSRWSSERAITSVALALPSSSWRRTASPARVRSPAVALPVSPSSRSGSSSARLRLRVAITRSGAA
jgi:hypothetical protein